MELRKVYDELNMRIDHVEQIAYAGGNEALWNQIKTADPVTGDEVSVSDAAPIYATNITAQIDPIQDLNGYDYPWTGGAGKNKLPYFTSDTESGVTISVDNKGVITINGTATAHVSFSVSILLKAGTYKVSGAYGNSDFYKTDLGASNRFYVHYGSNNVFDNKSGGREFTLASDTNCQAILVMVSGYTFDNSKVYPMIRLSAESADYEPYSNICPITGSSSEVLTVNGDDITIALGRTVYGGKLDVTSGKLVVTHGFETFDGSDDENWQNSSGGARAVTTLSNQIKGATNTRLEVISNEGYFSNSEDNAGVIFGWSNGSELYFYPPNGASDISAFKTWLSSNALQVCYELATPTTYQLTPKQIKLLQGLNTLSASTGSITIKYQPDNALGDILGQAQEFALNSVYIAPALDTGDKIADFAIGNTSGVLYETPAPEQTTRRTTKKSIKED